ncbi:energy transducer TonB [Anaerospora sp.]|uniref:energy transducer TonB n=1 Tax=Anaerospora sp. TaxID=1960278 RepID=UPI00289BC969|nr:energy transducer TonB [Anaerospora sp.]
MKKFKLALIITLLVISSITSVFAEGVTHPPRILMKVDTQYPEEAKKQGVEGVVVIKVSVSEQGEVEHLEISKSSGNESLDQAAIDSVKQWRFIPAYENGKKCSADAETAIIFKLK